MSKDLAGPQDFSTLSLLQRNDAMNTRNHKARPITAISSTISNYQKGQRPMSRNTQASTPFILQHGGISMDGGGSQSQSTKHLMGIRGGTFDNEKRFVAPLKNLFDNRYFNTNDQFRTFESQNSGRNNGSISTPSTGNLLTGMKRTFIKDAEIKKIKERHSPLAKKLHKQLSHASMQAMIQSKDQKGSKFAREFLRIRVQESSCKVGSQIKLPHQPIETPKDVMRIEEVSDDSKPMRRVVRGLRSSTLSKPKGDSPAKSSMLCPTLETPKLDLKLVFEKPTPSLNQVSRNIVNLAMAIGS